MQKSYQNKIINLSSMLELDFTPFIFNFNKSWYKHIFSWGVFGILKRNWLMLDLYNNDHSRYHMSLNEIIIFQKKSNWIMWWIVSFKFVKF